MLQRLYIRDFALIEELEVEFGPGLNIVTGETGAGKSILVGALKLILGDRASTDAVRTGAEKAVVEGHFEIDPDERLRALLRENQIDVRTDMILRREVTSSLSRAYINDSPATVSLLREVATDMVDLHGQHEHQSLLKAERHLPMVDAFGGLGDLVSAYRECYDEARAVHRRLEETRSRESELRREREFLQFQIEEIDRVAPEKGEDERLEAERRVLENAEELYEATARLFEMLYETEGAVNDLLVRARNDLRDLSGIDDEFLQTTEEISTAQISVAEAAHFLQDYNSRIEFNPERLEEIRSRLIDFDRLERKYGGTLDAVLEHRAEIGERYEVASDFDAALGRLQTEFTEACEKLSDAALRLNERRRTVADHIESAIVEELDVLGMPDSVFRVELSRSPDEEGWVTDPDDGRRYAAFPTGIDVGVFHISTNPGVAPMPLARVASGGEISRIMLALKTILARNDRLPMLIFDEIDTGISGAIAGRVGRCMKELASFHQIIAITHLPQVAAAGNSQYRVEKSTDGTSTRTTMRRLTEEERREDIARLLSGSTVTDAALRSARELLESSPAAAGD
ncbi:MAG: DNA repair protein RecN [Rhodothermales bacterium]|nr:DNA repair protein RecN [Rhodothermales bacterium]